MKYIIIILIIFNISAPAQEPLPSWRDTASKQKIISFVKSITDKNSSNYIPKSDRIAVFDNDGTMWMEQPIYFQLSFAIWKIKDILKKKPELKHQMPYKLIAKNDIKDILKGGKEAILSILEIAFSNSNKESLNQDINNWLKNQKHPRFGISYYHAVYRPMLELIRYLKLNGFSVFIVSGGGIDFMRAWIPQRYGIESYKILGSYAQTIYKNGEIIKKPKIAFVNDKANKPIAIYRNIGKRPILACGNSDGDLAMLEYSSYSKYPSLQIYIHHTDAKREYRYDRDSKIGRLDRGLDIASKRDWLIIDMAKDWKRIFDIED